MSTEQITKELTVLREGAMAILRMKGLVGDDGIVPLPGEDGYKDNAVGAFIGKNSYSRYFTEWENKLNDLFDRANLDFILLKHRVMTVLGKKQKQPAAVFIKLVNELDEMIGDEKRLKSYCKETLRANSWPALTYCNGVVYQGLDKQYRIQSDLVKRFFNLMWKSRTIVAPITGLFVAKYGKNISREELFKRLEIVNPDRLNDIIDTVNSAAKRNKMNIAVKSPHAETVYIEVTQDLVPDHP